jgi:hypothetical protein
LTRHPLPLGPKEAIKSLTSLGVLKDLDAGSSPA